MTDNTLGLYIHLPWCVRKCPYCDFNSHTLRGHIPESEYVTALLADLAADCLEFAGAKKITSIFIGGGTPSLFSAEAVTRLLNEAATLIPFVADVEITLECNPGSADTDNFAGYRAAGVNRLSVGVQSFNDGHLQTLGRIHSAAEAVAAVQAAQHVGFENLNLDIMYGLPTQTAAQAAADIDQALELNVAHLSHYQLTLEPNTQFAHHPPELPHEDVIEAMETNCREQLKRAGYEHYEVSAFAQPHHRCQHNLNYWQFGDYLGIGAGAHDKVRDPAGQSWRRAKVANPQEYLQKAAGPARVTRQRRLERAELPVEFLLNWGRLLTPFSGADFEQASGLSASELRAGPWLEAEQQEHLVRWQDGWQITPQGHRFLNDLLVLFLPEQPARSIKMDPDPASGQLPYAHSEPRMP
jgi:putative oxygen-independent coproporphyrinogen III oxidase